uniref:Uncharacterized protein n=1 Tax=Rhizophora mucronata TaxID=61149 RepID=A0A2P2NFC6_RHIMU
MNNFCIAGHSHHMTID